MEIRPKPLFIIMPWFKAFPKSKLEMHYQWTLRRNPSFNGTPYSHPDIGKLPKFMFNHTKDRDGNPPFHHQIRDEAHRLYGIEDQIAEYEAWCDNETRNRFRRERKRRGVDRRVKAIRAIDRRLKKCIRKRDALALKHGPDCVWVIRRTKEIARLNSRRDRLWNSGIGRAYSVRLVDRVVTRLADGREKTDRRDVTLRRVWLYDHEVAAYGFNRAVRRELGLESCDD